MLMMTTITGSIILYDDSSSEDTTNYGTCSISNVLLYDTSVHSDISVHFVTVCLKLGETADFDSYIF